MQKLRNITALVTCSLFILVACQKWKDPAAKTDPRLTNPYCNDPEAVNYNWGFPGKPDSTTCVYPADKYVGDYLYHDSVYLADNTLTYAKPTPDTLHIYALSKTIIGVVGFCDDKSMLKFDVDRTLNTIMDTTGGAKGQMFCTPGDTATGGISPDATDTTHSRYFINLSVQIDTLVNIHKGIARKAYLSPAHPVTTQKSGGSN
jgi:hypothetical protein